MHDGHDETQPQATQPAEETPEAQEAPAVEETSEVQDEQPGQATQPQAGGDVSTAPPTAPAPLPGVPAAPVNATAKDGDVPGPRMDPSRIGEATQHAQQVEDDAKASS